MADFELTGFEAMLAALRQYPARVAAETPSGLGEAAAALEAQIKVELSRSSHPRGTPTPSPPGSPPSLISGNLRRSVQVEGPVVSGAWRWSVNVGPEAVYSRVQELGGGPSNLPPRPYVAPALMTALPAMAQYIEEAWADALR